MSTVPTGHILKSSFIEILTYLWLPTVAVVSIHGFVEAYQNQCSSPHHLADISIEISVNCHSTMDPNVLLLYLVADNVIALHLQHLIDKVIVLKTMSSVMIDKA